MKKCKRYESYNKRYESYKKTFKKTFYAETVYERDGSRKLDVFMTVKGIGTVWLLRTTSTKGVWDLLGIHPVTEAQLLEFKGSAYRRNPHLGKVVERILSYVNYGMNELLEEYNEKQFCREAENLLRIPEEETDRYAYIDYDMELAG